MKSFHRLVIAPLVASLILPASVFAAANKAALSEADQKRLAAFHRFIQSVDKPQERTFGQVLNSMKPFVSVEMMEALEKKVGPRMDSVFPSYRLKKAGEDLELEVGKNKSTQVMMHFFTKDPKNFAKVGSVVITRADVTDALGLIEKLEKGVRSASRPSSLKALIFSEVAHAEFDWAIGIGLVALAGGIAWGFHSLSRSKIKVDVPTNYTANVNVPTAYTLNTQSNVDTTFSLPQLNPYLKSTGQK